MGIHQLLYSSCCFLNTNTAIAQQLIQTARTLEAEWCQVCEEAWVRGQRQMSQVLDNVWAAGFYHVTVRSRLARVSKIMKPFISLTLSLLMSYIYHVPLS